MMIHKQQFATMHSCEVQFLQNPKLSTGRFQQQSQARSQCAVWLSCALSVHSIRSSRSACLIHTNSFETTCCGKRRSSGMVDQPLQNFATMQSGVVGRDGCSDAVVPHSRRSRMQTQRRSQVSRAGCTHAQHCGQITEYRILAWRSPPNGDRRCPSHLSHHVRSNV